MYVRKTLSTVLLIWCLHDILLLKVTPRHATLFTKGISRPFSCYTTSGTLSSWRHRLPVISLHWSLCSSAHTTDSLRWGRVAVFGEHDVHISLSLYIASGLTAQNTPPPTVPLLLCDPSAGCCLATDRLLFEPLTRNGRSLSYHVTTYIWNICHFSGNVGWNVK
jgi:hypothetical protein